MPIAPSIFITLGTRLHMIVKRHDDGKCDVLETGDVAATWEVWTATNTRAGDSSTWTGTFLRLHPDGTVYQVTRDPHGEEHEMRIM